MRTLTDRQARKPDLRRSVVQLTIRKSTEGIIPILHGRWIIEQGFGLIDEFLA